MINFQPLGVALGEIENADVHAWLYLPADEPWSVESRSVVLRSEEFDPDAEDLPDAGVPLAAREARLRQVLPVAVVQDVVANARLQMHRPTSSQLFDAFQFYFQRDAFIIFDAPA